MNDAETAFRDGNVNITPENIGSNKVHTWTCNVERNVWSRVLYIDDGFSGILNVLFNQNGQFVLYSYNIATGYNFAEIFQIGANGSAANSEIQVRIMRHTSAATHYVVEILNPYTYNNVQYVKANLQFEETNKNSTASAYPIAVLTGAGDDYPILKAIIASTHDGIVAPNFYGNLVGNAATAAMPTGFANRMDSDAKAC